MEKEIWKDVPGYEGLYQASSFGRIRSVDRFITMKNGTVRFTKGKMLKQRCDENGRLCVSLSKNGKAKSVRGYVVTMLTFVGERPKGYDICHLDDNVKNNKLSNLRYDTKKQNSTDVYRNGNLNPRGKLTIQDVIDIRNYYKNGTYKQIELAKIYNVDKNSICNIIRRRTFKWLNDDGTINESKTQIK